MSNNRNTWKDGAGDLQNERWCVVKLHDLDLDRDRRVEKMYGNFVGTRAEAEVALQRWADAYPHNAHALALARVFIPEIKLQSVVVDWEPTA